MNRLIWREHIGNDLTHEWVSYAAAHKKTLEDFWDDFFLRNYGYDPIRSAIGLTNDGYWAMNVKLAHNCE